MLTNTVPVNMVPILDDTVVVCAARCNLRPPQVHPEAQLQTQNMNMMGDDPGDQAEAAWSQENAWLGRLEQIWSDPGVDHYSRVSAWSSWVRLLVEFNRPEEWLYSAAQGA
ncbi:hypothetical protein Bbelb_049670 [Branchiostoma belcheri]|nr:hypothetical protein Bbelb_049670 [Branchiostoma belcheri]